MVDDRIRQHFGFIWTEHVGGLVELLIAARASCGDDLELVLVLAIIGDRTFEPAEPEQELSFADWQRSGAAAARGVNVRSIADYSGIPRETVRRKVAKLIARGWVARGEGHTLRATTAARIELQRMTERSIQYLARLEKAFARLPR